MTPRIEIFKCFLRLLKFKYLVNYRLYLVFFIETNHFFQSITRSIQQSFQCDVPLQSQYIRICAIVRRILLAGEIPACMLQLYFLF